MKREDLLSEEDFEGMDKCFTVSMFIFFFLALTILSVFSLSIYQIAYLYM